jgi:hypothetical protein
MSGLLNQAAWRTAPFALRCNAFKKGFVPIAGRCGAFSLRYLPWYRHGKRVISLPVSI